MKKWVISALQKFFSGGKLTQNLPKINLVSVYEYQYWYKKMKLLTSFINLKDFGRALECLKNLSMVYSKHQQIFCGYESKIFFDLLLELLLFCQDGLEILSIFSVNKMLKSDVKHEHKHGCNLKPIKNQHRFEKFEHGVLKTSTNFLWL